jgi:hypothetical protein
MLMYLQAKAHRGLSHDSLTSQAGDEGSARDITSQIDRASSVVPRQ